MTYQYKQDDLFYDVESLENIFTVAWWYPHENVNAIILSYLDDDNIIQSEHEQDIIRERIYELHPNLKAGNTQIVFENIAYTGRINEFGPGSLGMQSFAKRLGLAHENNYLNKPVDKRSIEGGSVWYHPAYFPVKQTDPDFNDDKHGYRFGYNATNYDVTILAYVLSGIHDKFYTPEYAHQPIDEIAGKPFTASSIRAFNDELFSPEWKGRMPKLLAHVSGTDPETWGDFRQLGWILRKSWLLTGRYIDVARLNEKLQKVGLKRLLGMLGLHIMESDKLEDDTIVRSIDEVADLLAYNISDVVNLQALFEHEVYQNAFNLRGELLKTYPQTVYDQKAGFPSGSQEMPVDDGNPVNIRRDRLTRDSTSAKFVEKAIAPYTPIQDAKTVSLMYPSKREARKLGIEQVDVLEETRRFFEQNVTADPNDQAHQDFMEVYNFYDKIRGRNFNTSQAYSDHYGYEGVPAEAKGYIAGLMSRHNTNLFYHYVHADGTVSRTSCLANFSIGGIHGAEVNMQKYLEDYNEYRREKDIQEYVENQYKSALEAVNGPTYITLPDHLELTDRIRKKMKDDGSIKIREFTKGGSTKKKAEWRDVKEAELFKKNSSGNWSVHPNYAYVSVGESHHEDFTSYYPLLLSRLSVFENPSYHGYEDDGEPKDPYYEMFLTRVEKKKEAKDKSLSEEQRNRADLDQNLRKLLINAASGAGDATFDNNIRANNNVIAMRIIGQLFAWRIGQAQALAGARVPSTNTDGLYTMDISAETNDRILEETVQDMHIGIEPERLARFVSKDSNNRLEHDGKKIAEAKGGTLNSWEGPEPEQSLDHAAIIDHILAEYLADTNIENPANEPFRRDIAEQKFYDFIQAHIQNGTPQEALRFFQWIVSSSPGKHRYAFLKHTNQHTGETRIEKLQQYSRIFLIKHGSDNLHSEIYMAIRRAIGKPAWQKREREYKAGDRLYSDMWDHDEEAVTILEKNGFDIHMHNQDPSSEYCKDEAKVVKVRTMPENQHVGLYNQSIVDLSHSEAVKMIQMLDIKAYTDILHNTFKSWSNIPS